MEEIIDQIKEYAPYFVVGGTILALVGWFIFVTFGNPEYKRKGWDYVKNLVVVIGFAILLVKLFPSFGTTLTNFMNDPCSIVGASCN